MNPEAFQHRILQWFDQHGRKDLPWQANPTPYRVWVSEIMLQQTQVATVIPYYRSFMKRFPSVKKLATAPEDDVLHQWTGLGYYARARNLHKTARIVHQDFHGRFPDDPVTLESLPGIGRSTAAAIRSLAFRQPAAILDGNVKRVIARFAAIEGWPGKPSVTRKLWEVAEQYAPLQGPNQKRCADYTQAMMDLGATICTRSRPRCTECPLENHCIARQTATTEHFPGKKAASKKPVKESYFLIMMNGNEVLLEKRPPQGIWGGLWSLPETKALESITELSRRYGLTVQEIRELPTRSHTFSHFQLQWTPVICSVEPTGQINEPATQWACLNELPAIGLAAPVKKILSEIRELP